LKIRLLLAYVFSVEFFVLYLLLSPFINLLGSGNIIDSNSIHDHVTIVLGSESPYAPLPFPCSSLKVLITNLRLDGQENGNDVIYIGTPITLRLNLESIDQGVMDKDDGDYFGMIQNEHVQVSRSNWTAAVEILDSNDIAVVTLVKRANLADNNSTQTTSTIVIPNGFPKAGEYTVKVFLVSNPNLELAEVLSPTNKLRVNVVDGILSNNKKPLLTPPSIGNNSNSRNMTNSTFVLYDDFSGDPYTLEDGEFSPDCKWQSIHNGFGSLGVRSENDSNAERSVFFEMPARSVGSSGVNPDNRTTYGTHAGLVLTTSHDYKNFHLSLDVKTMEQLRIANPPNPWETAWIMFDYVDDWHHYYLIPKPNGVELGKKDNNSQLEKQIDLISVSNPKSSVGSWQHLDLIVEENRFRAFVNGSKVIDYVDQSLSNEEFGRGGAVGLYTEDAEVVFDNVYITRMS